MKKLKKVILLSLFFVLGVEISFAQNPKYLRDVIVLKDGTEYVGMITSTINGKSVTINTLDNHTYTIPIDEITKTEKKYLYKYNKPKGNYWEITFTALEDGLLFYELDFSFGKKFSPLLQLALGTGLGFPGAGDIDLPFFVEYKGDFLSNSAVSPYIEGRAGYLLSAECYSGPLLRVGGGISFNLGQRNKRMCIGFILQASSDYDYVWDGEKRYDETTPLSLLCCGLTTRFSF